MTDSFNKHYSSEEDDYAEWRRKQEIEDMLNYKTYSNKNPSKERTMIDKQPDALRLAGQLERMSLSTPWDKKAAAELRRLHEVNAELVEALTWALAGIRFDPIEQPLAHKLWTDAKAALNKAEGK